MSDTIPSRKPRKLRWWLLLLVPVGCCVLAFIALQIIWQLRFGGMPISAVTGGVLADCVWSGIAEAWIDVNDNGLKDQGDPPFPGVDFHVDDTLNQITDVGGITGSSSWKGEAYLHVWLPGCPEAKFEVYADTPSDYTPVTDLRLAADVRDADEIFSFGFKRLSNLPTITPRPRSPICESVRLGVSNRFDITDIKVASDGSVWVSTFNDGVRWLPAGETEWVYFHIEDGLISDQVRRIIVLPDGAVWFSTDGGASSFDGERWISFSSSDGLVNDNVYDIAVAPGGEVWFATFAGISRYDPDTQKWTSLPSSSIIKAIAIGPDGTPWVAPSLGTVARVETASSNNLSLAGGPQFESADQLAFAADGTLWIAGFDGIASYQPETEELVIYDSVSTSGAIGDGANALAHSPDESI